MRTHPPSRQDTIETQHVSRAEARIEVRRSRLASVLYGITRPGQARAATVNANALALTFAFRSKEIPLGAIDTAELEAGRCWDRVRIRYVSGNVVVSGLSRTDAKSLTRTLEAARVDWWRRTLAAQLETLRSVHARVSKLETPPRYMSDSVWSDLERAAQKVAGQLAGQWPATLSRAPEVQLLKPIRDFLKGGGPLRASVNQAFVASELN